jgi:hypothetical protein
MVAAWRGQHAIVDLLLKRGASAGVLSEVSTKKETFASSSRSSKSCLTVQIVSSASTRRSGVYAALSH